MKPVLIETNVLCAANGLAEQVSAQCKGACAELLTQIMVEGHFLVDEQYAIFNEYQNKNEPTDKGGPGNAFLLWALRNRANPERCTQVPITHHPERGYEEFPDTPELSSFDPSDRKFVAVALSHHQQTGHMPVIHNATDTDWAHPAHHAAFTAHGLRIAFVCPDYLAAPQ